MCRRSKNSGCKIGSIIYVGETKTPEISGIYFDEVLENVHEQMSDEVGEIADGWDIEYPEDKGKYEEYEEKLKQLVVDYLKRNWNGTIFFYSNQYKRSCYQVGGTI